MTDDDQKFLKQLRSAREKANWEIEKDRYELHNEVYRLFRDWKGQKPNLREIFRPEEIEWFLVENMKIYNDNPYTRTPFDRKDVIINFLNSISYKDEPYLDENGKLLLRRKTAVHGGANFTPCWTVRKLFDIYDRYDVNYTEESGFSHFHAACQHGCEDIVIKFLELGLDPNCLSQELVTSLVDPPLHLALIYEHKKIFKILLRNGVDPNKANAKGSTLLHIICFYYSYSADWAKSLFEISKNKYQPVQVNAQDEKGQTPLHVALSRRRIGLIKLLLRNGADPYIADAEGLTPLHIACNDEHDSDHDVYTLAKIFFKINDEKHQKMRIDAQDNLGRTPLHMAVSDSCEKLMQLLLNRGANRNLTDANGLTPLHIICKKEISMWQREDTIELATILFKVTNFPPPSLPVKKKNNKKKVSNDKHQLVKVNSVDNLGRTPLEWAAENLMSDMVDVLLNHGADWSNFIFPTEAFIDKYNKSYECYHNDTKINVAFYALKVIHHLERRRYKFNQSDTMMIMKTFITHSLMDESIDVDECLRRDQIFLSESKNLMMNSKLSLYDFLQLPPAKAEKVFTLEDYDKFTSKITYFRDQSHRAYMKYLYETAIRRFFRRWALDFFLSLTHYELPILCCEKIIRPLKIKHLWYICLAATGENQSF